MEDWFRHEHGVDNTIKICSAKDTFVRSHIEKRTRLGFVTSLPKKYKRCKKYKGRFWSLFTSNKLVTLFRRIVNIKVESRLSLKDKWREELWVTSNIEVKDSPRVFIWKKKSYLPRPLSKLVHSIQKKRTKKSNPICKQAENIV